MRKKIKYELLQQRSLKRYDVKEREREDNCADTP